MDSVLCDEVLQEIFQRLAPPSAAAASLVSKRWLHLHRAAKTSITLRLPFPPSLLSLYPHLSSLTIISHSQSQISTTTAAALPLPLPRSLRRLRLVSAPLPASALLPLSSSCPLLSSLSLSLLPPLSLHSWLPSFPSLTHLSISIPIPKSDSNQHQPHPADHAIAQLPLQTLCLSGIGVSDSGLGWLWRSCAALKTLKLRSCEGLGDDSEFNYFINCFKGLQELELRTCRSVVDWVLLHLGRHCFSLRSLLLYDGGNRDALLRYLSQSNSTLKRLDLRLPLDLENDHLFAAAESFRGLTTFRLQSCCLVTGEGLNRLTSELGTGIEELGLINCDVVERESGLLANLGQKLTGLKRLDLSYNEMLCDKELVSMLVSCPGLVEIKLRGCKGLTEETLLCILKSCECLESLDIAQCGGIGAGVVQLFVSKSKRLRQVYVEESKVSAAAKRFSSLKFMEVGVS
ncbi:hypothetical protein Sjap_016207 [Stephania japonica]|uniref:F-box domain-containing protein n=1 Tax=Stephania japonica TaxID=461633 RepID=A0AAP0IL51_9MAGN